MSNCLFTCLYQSLCLICFFARKRQGDNSKTAEAAERFETWGGGGGSSYTKPSAYPYSNFPKGLLRSSLAQANLFAISKVSMVCP